MPDWQLACLPFINPVTLPHGYNVQSDVIVNAGYKTAHGRGYYRIGVVSALFSSTFLTEDDLNCLSRMLRASHLNTLLFKHTLTPETFVICVRILLTRQTEIICSRDGHCRGGFIKSETGEC